MAKYLDENGLLYYDKAQQARLATKVDKVDGKGLSTNDYTTDEKTKLGNIEAGAQVNKIESIKVNGVTATITGKEAAVDIDPSKIDHIKVNNVEQTITDKTVNIAVPTKTSDITNDSNFAVDASYVHTDNNYTTDDKTKLGAIASGAQVNVIESVKVNGTALGVTDKAVDITVPTKVSDLTNDSKFQTDTQVNAAITEAIKDITGIEYKICAAGEYDETTRKPTVTGAKGVIYLVPKTSSETNNVYIEWVYVGSDYEKIGDTAIDLSNYWNTDNLKAITNAEIDTILATPAA